MTLTTHAVTMSATEADGKTSVLTKHPNNVFKVNISVEAISIYEDVSKD